MCVNRLLACFSVCYIVVKLNKTTSTITTTIATATNTTTTTTTIYLYLLIVIELGSWTIARHCSQSFASIIGFSNV